MAKGIRSPKTAKVHKPDRPLTWDDLGTSLQVRYADAKAGTSGRIPDSGTSSTQEGQRDERFYHGTVEDALRMLAQGWPEGTSDLVAQLEDATRYVEAPAWDMGPAGVMPCVPAYLSGEVECMFMRTEEPQADTRVTLAVPLCYSGAVPARNAMAYAVALAALVRSLEDSGRTVAVLGYHMVAGDRGNNMYGPTVRVRDFGEPLDLDKVAFLMHPLMLRRCLFAYMETRDDWPAVVRSMGYGSVTRPSPETLAEIFPDAGELVHLPQLIGGGDSAYWLAQMERTLAPTAAV